MTEETITVEQLNKLLDFIDSLEVLSASDWESVCDACADFDIPLMRTPDKG